MKFENVVHNLKIDSLGELTTIKSQKRVNKIWFLGKEIQNIFNLKDLSQAIHQAGLTPNEIYFLTRKTHDRFFMDLRNRIPIFTKYSKSITLISKEGLIKLVANSEKVINKESVIKELGIENPIILKTLKEVSFGLILKEFCNDLKIKLIHQHPVNGFLIDFYLPELKLGIEFDEMYHNTAKQSTLDDLREDEISLYNIKIIRISEKSYNMGNIFSEITKRHINNK